MDRVRLGGGLRSDRLLISSSGFCVSGAGEGGIDESVEAGVISNVLLGVGRWIGGISIVQVKQLSVGIRGLGVLSSA